MISVTNLNKFYGKFHAVKDLSFQVDEGEIFGFLGPNGAGKSTTIRMLLGMIRPSSGKATVQSLDIESNSLEIRRITGYLPGEMAFPKQLTAQNIVDFALEIHNKGGEKAKKLFDRLDLDPKKRVKDMSKGMKQKLGIITTLAHDPKVIILDEPTSGLDPLMQAEFNQLLLEEKENGKTIFMSSHILSDVEHLCDRIGIINLGQLLFTGTLVELYQGLPYEVRLTLRTPEVLSITNAEHVQQKERKVSFQYAPPLEPLLQQLQAYPIEHITINPPSLDAIFLNYYKKEGSR